MISQSLYVFYHSHILNFLVEKKDDTSGHQPKIVTSDEIKEDENYVDSDRLYFTKQHIKEALKDFRDQFHHQNEHQDVQEISRSEAGKP